MPSARDKPDYGVDAPRVIRNLLIAGVAGLLIWIAAWASGSSFQLVIPTGKSRLIFPVARMAGFAGLGCAAMGLWMLWSSKVGKLHEREKLLDQIRWNGAERVLDVGCGRGLMLVGAAKRLTTGSAVGVDIWSAEDLSGNKPEATLENARREGVSDRVEVQTADMRKLPFPDRSFDVVVSCAAIHNLYSAPDRAKAIVEIARVLKPGGRAVIDDIRHGQEYARTFVRNGCADVRPLHSRVGAALLAAITFGSMRPTVLLARKNG
jgi:ubiquinone/menaquinone biosynthesis C-methylase UbiE